MKNDDKREMTIDELEEQISEMKAKYDDLNKKLKQKKQDEADRKKAQLALEKDARYKEIVETSKHLNQLITDYTEDYGSFSFTRSSSEDDTFRFPWLWRYFF